MFLISERSPSVLETMLLNDYFLKSNWMSFCLLVSFAYMCFFIRCFQFLLGSWNQLIFFYRLSERDVEPLHGSPDVAGGFMVFFFPTCLKLLPWKLTWNLKITQLKRKIIFQTSTNVFHVNFPGRKTVFILLGELFLPEISIVVVNLITTWEFWYPERYFRRKIPKETYFCLTYK